MTKTPSPRRALLALLFLAVAASAAAGTPSFGSGTDVWVAAAAHSAGSENTFWVTDVWIVAPDGAAQVDVHYLAAGLTQSSANLALPPVRVTVPAGGQLTLADVLGSRFGVTSGAGALRFRSVGSPAAPILVASRTYNTGATGTYGQFIPGLPADRAFGLSDGTAATAQQAIGLLNDPVEFRTNVGVLNVSATDPATVKIEVRSRSGELLGSISETFQPWTGLQYNRIFQAIGRDPEDDARAIVRVTAGAGRVLAYASVVDNRTGDPIYVPGTNGQ